MARGVIVCEHCEQELLAENFSVIGQYPVCKDNMDCMQYVAELDWEEEKARTVKGAKK